MAKGFYVNGKRVPSITTVLNGQNGWNKGALIGWAHRVGLSGQSNLYAKLNQAALAGTCAHELIQAHTEKRDPRIERFTDAARKLAQVSFDTFLNWEALHKPEYRGAELDVISEKHMFGGRLDHLIKAHNQLWLLSIKTGKGVYEDNILQVAAEKAAYEEQELTKIDQCHIIALDKETGNLVHKCIIDTADAFRAFLCMRELYDLQKSVKAAA